MIRVLGILIGIGIAVYGAKKGDFPIVGIGIITIVASLFIPFSPETAH